MASGDPTTCRFDALDKRLDRMEDENREQMRELREYIHKELKDLQAAQEKDREKSGKVWAWIYMAIGFVAAFNFIKDILPTIWRGGAR